MDPIRRHLYIFHQIRWYSYPHIQVFGSRKIFYLPHKMNPSFFLNIYPNFNTVIKLIHSIYKHSTNRTFYVNEHLSYLNWLCFEKDGVNRKMMVGPSNSVNVIFDKCYQQLQKRQCSSHKR